MTRKPKARPVKTCAAHVSIGYGNKQCDKEITSVSDLCLEHYQQLLPHQLINGRLYIGEKE